MHTSTIQLKFPSPDTARTIYESVKLEQSAIPNPRIKVESDLDGDTIAFHCTAKDLTALRAGINSHLKWVMVASEVMTSLDENVHS